MGEVTHHLRSDGWVRVEKPIHHDHAPTPDRTINEVVTKSKGDSPMLLTSIHRSQEDATRCTSIYCGSLMSRSREANSKRWRRLRGVHCATEDSACLPA